MAYSQSFLFLILVGVVVSTLTIILIFIIINACISKHIAKLRIQKMKQNQENANEYFKQNSPLSTHKEVEEKPPPLPSRDQFLIPTESRSNSYEQMDTLVEPLEEETQNLPPPPPLFIESPEIQNTWTDAKSVSESYDDIGELEQNVCQSYEDVASLPDYVELEDDPPAFQEPQLLNIQASSRESLASYDDVGAIDNVSEDYDDVGC